MAINIDKEDAIFNSCFCFIVGSLFLIMGIGSIINGSPFHGQTEDIFMGSISAIFGFLGIISSIIYITKLRYGIVDISKYTDYIESNKTSIGLFARPVFQKTKIIFANKFVVIEFDVRDIGTGNGKIIIIDKLKSEKTDIIIKRPGICTYYKFFTDILCNIIDYETVTEDIFDLLEKKSIFFSIKKIKKIKKPLYLDINKASEAELTAIPGVTIAKAKHAIKMRKKYSFYLTMNQFYETINLDEEFIEQIQTKGKKIVLNSLPEYKMLQMKKEEE